MNAFRVWLGPLGDSCRVQIDGMENAEWLLSRLIQHSSIFQRCKPISQEEGSSICSFQVLHNPPLPSSRFGELLAKIPTVKLMSGPE